MDQLLSGSPLASGKKTGVDEPRTIVETLEEKESLCSLEEVTGIPFFGYGTG